MALTFDRTAEIDFNFNDILARLDPNNAEHNTVALALLDRLLDLHNSQKISARFAMAADHRRQIRLWCSIHLLIPHVRTDGHTWMARFLDAIDLELVVSTRYYAEIGPNLPAAAKPDFVRAALHYLPPWLASNHFTIRLFAQLAVLRFWSLREALLPATSSAVNPAADGDDGETAGLPSLVAFLRSNPECKRNLRRADRLYFVGGAFRPLDDVTIGFIFRGGLLVAGVGEAERISSRAFERVDPSPGRFVRLHHDTARRAYWIPDELDLESLGEGDGDGTPHAVPPSIDPKGSTSEANVTLDDSDNYDGAIEAVQRKIVPWEAFMMTDLDFSVGRGAIREKRRNPLIVVASLISRAPNLGGLCRTSEIFNAELFVVSNLRIRSDAEFQATAVTSDRWMPMAEVPEDGLRAFLRAKKDQGYALLGIEQASNSIRLDTFSFPQRSVLLLGRELQGVPADLLPMLDHVLEIPQFGLVRSLNVHVSAAIAVWEYTRQLLQPNNSTGTSGAGAVVEGSTLATE
ncbi:Tar (HIV-1) RNA binding protein 1 [Cladochytrium tenue]|nr:Tar (HIV-1) RNA binding protein 1 [Cladochytrium tenue]